MNLSLILRSEAGREGIASGIEFARSPCAGGSLGTESNPRGGLRPRSQIVFTAIHCMRCLKLSSGLSWESQKSDDELLSFRRGYCRLQPDSSRKSGEGQINGAAESAAVGVPRRSPGPAFCSSNLGRQSAPLRYMLILTVSASGVFFPQGVPPRRRLNSILT